jgi:phospholipid-translocating ATPase
VCAVGDGRNDVNMIRSANVGIGIKGKEGFHASNASDYAITEFRHIIRLFLWHGRNSYIRSANICQFILQRGLIISFMQVGVLTAYLVIDLNLNLKEHRK